MMRSWFATATSLRFLLLALAVSDTLAIECSIYEESIIARLGGKKEVSNQQELDIKYAGCTEIDGPVIIAADYTGDFYFPNVTKIYNGLITVNHYSQRQHQQEQVPVPLLTSIEVPDLNNTRFIEIHGVPALRTISFPSLTILDDSLSLDEVEDCFVDFPSLTRTVDLQIIGNVTRLSFPLLADGGTMRVSSNPKSDKEYSNYLIVDPVDQAPLDIKFPALQNATSIYLQGSITSLSMPQLSKIGNDRQFDAGNLRILTHGNRLNISLPSLSNLRHLSAAGTIGSLNFASLQSIERFEVNTSTPLNVTMEPMGAITEILHLLGDVTAVSISSLYLLFNLVIESDSSDFYCSSIASDFERLQGRKLKSYDCIGHPPKSKLPLQLGLGLGLGIPVFLVVAFLLRLFFKGPWVKKVWGTEMWTPQPVVKPPAYELGVPPTYATDGPPTYDASEGEQGSEQGAANVAGTHMGDGSSVRGEGASEHSAGDAASARLGDGSSALHEGASGRRVT
ncbi:hypothetical protein VE01_09654 [Pseudogymnoascus verrucosus]|uniref:Protein ecm33 n=1 Tax=Pseudogymnoascus verrucosus TaxID=342668 RepID=A0A1B8G9U2_9PEZI|nr:uncharacterized protein VE01_09654 [Pseudogymnoascus verrucosus]OBT92605.2 hypothetical protein VE01_09654 [Pseudogymnoascus verrucosus]